MSPQMKLETRSPNMSNLYNCAHLGILEHPSEYARAPPSMPAHEHILAPQSMPAHASALPNTSPHLKACPRTFENAHLISLSTPTYI